MVGFRRKAIWGNWNLSGYAKEAADLQVWDYYNPADSDDDAPAVDIDACLVEDLELELQNSLSLRLAPSLRRAHLRRLATESGQKQMNNKKERNKIREIRAQLRKKKEVEVVACSN